MGTACAAMTDDNNITRSDILRAASTAVILAGSSPYSSLRRPETTNTQDFWYCSEELWQELLNDTTVPEKKKVALNRLRKYEAAGMIMETSAGKTSPSPCYYCTRPGDTHECRVLDADGERVCAYCKCKGKSGCTAGEAVVEENSDEDSELAAMRLRVETAEAKNVSLEERISVLEAKVAAVDSKVGLLDSYCQQWFSWLKTEAVIKSRDVYALWKAVWPNSDREPPAENV